MKMEPNKNDTGERKGRIYKKREYIFDPINLIEMPFCSLNTKQSGREKIPLSVDGTRYRYCPPPPPDLWEKFPKEAADELAKRYGEPTALAEKVMLALLTKARDQNNFATNQISFGLRELVENYMYPNTYKKKKKRAGGTLLKRVEQELYRMRHCQIYDTNWWDPKLRKRIEVDTSHINTIAVLQEGDGSSPRVLQVVWGDKLYESIEAGYTKGIDSRKFDGLSPGLDLRLFRWLDRELALPPHVQKVFSCQKWALEVLALNNSKTQGGGRSASSYIYRQIQGRLEHYKEMGYFVDCEVNDSKPDFSFTFKLLRSVESKDTLEDLASDLVFEFKKRFHGVDRLGSVSPGDKVAAEKWLTEYGFEKAKWMIRRCRELHCSAEPVRKINGLEAFGYKDLAEADYGKYLKRQQRKKEKELKIEREKLWEKYESVMLQKADESGFHTSELEAMAKAAAMKSGRQAFDLGIRSAQQAHIRIELKKIKLNQVNALTRQQFDDFESKETLIAALEKRHGYNPLKRH